MALKTFKAVIYVKPGVTQEIRVQADDVFKAKDLINRQYGNPKLFGTVQEVRR
jgi:hypothetical protein